VRELFSEARQAARHRLHRRGRGRARGGTHAPDQKGRLEILRMHTRDVPLGEDVDLGRLARSTPGMTGADLANLVNEAAIMAARRGLTAVGPCELAMRWRRFSLELEAW
jgi:cell division protease FtsH